MAPRGLWGSQTSKGAGPGQGAPTQGRWLGEKKWLLAQLSATEQSHLTQPHRPQDSKGHLPFSALAHPEFLRTSKIPQG